MQLMLSHSMKVLVSNYNSGLKIFRHVHIVTMYNNAVPEVWSLIFFKMTTLWCDCMSVCTLIVWG